MATVEVKRNLLGLATKLAHDRLFNWMVVPATVCTLIYFGLNKNADVDIARQAARAKPINLSGPVSLSWSKHPVLRITSAGKTYRIRCDTNDSAGACLNISQYPEDRSVQVFSYHGWLIILASETPDGVVKLSRERQLYNLRGYAAALQRSVANHFILKLGLLFGIAAGACRHMMLNEANRRRGLKIQRV